MKGFEDFVMDIHAKDYIGCDDDMPDDFSEWLEDRSIDDWIEYGDKFAKKRKKSIEVDEEKIKGWLFPLVERIHNIAHSYMKDKINASECREQQQKEIIRTAKAIVVAGYIKKSDSLLGMCELALKMIDCKVCPNDCSNGVIQLSEGEIEQCQWCDEKKKIAHAIAQHKEDFLK